LTGLPYTVAADDPALRAAYLAHARLVPRPAQAPRASYHPLTIAGEPTDANTSPADRLAHPDRRPAEGSGGGPAFEAIGAAYWLLRDPAAAAAQAQRNCRISPLLLAAGAGATAAPGAGEGGGVGGAPGGGPRAAFKARLVVTVREFFRGGEGMPLGLLPKKYEQLWGTPLPASEALGCAHASPPWSRVRVVAVASAHWGPTVFGLAWTRVILGHYCLLPELFMCLRTVGCDRGSAC
jgi:hypothetical protein